MRKIELFITNEGLKLLSVIDSIVEKTEKRKEKITVKTTRTLQENIDMVGENKSTHEADKNDAKEGNIISETVGKVKEFIKGDLTAEEVLEQRKQEIKGEREYSEQTKNESSNRQKDDI